MNKESSFGEDVEFLRRHVETIVLSNDDGAAIAVVPAYQGRTMTSTAKGDGGTSFGWINYDLIESGKHDPQVNLYGGEDRFWVSPEGGQFSIFFDPGVGMKYENWRTPPIIDDQPFDLIQQSDQSVSFSKRGSLRNYSDVQFDIEFERTVSLISKTAIAKEFGWELKDLRVVAHESQNSLRNVGKTAWKQETGLISIWILCMNKPSPGATVLVPFRKGSCEDLGPIVNADYFGKLDKSRLIVEEDQGLIYFRGDGEMRSKLGLTFERVTSTLGSWDPQRGVFSIVDFNLPNEAPHGYTNNLWEIQEEPFAGDVINSYNDGPNETGGSLGGFFELETISPALALQPSEQFTHRHRTIRIEGDRSKIDRVAQTVFNVSLDEIESKFIDKPNRN